MRIKDNFETTGGIDNEESSIGISNCKCVYYVVISCGSCDRIAVRVEVNGERVYFRTSSHYRFKREDPGTGEIYSGEVGSERNMGWKREKGSV